jgi:hypothetical protein
MKICAVGWVVWLSYLTNEWSFRKYKVRHTLNRYSWLSCVGYDSGVPSVMTICYVRSARRLRLRAHIPLVVFGWLRLLIARLLNWSGCEKNTAELYVLALFLHFLDGLRKITKVFIWNPYLSNVSPIMCLDAMFMCSKTSCHFPPLVWYNAVII